MIKDPVDDRIMYQRRFFHGAKNGTFGGAQINTSKGPSSPPTEADYPSGKRLSRWSLRHQPRHGQRKKAFPSSE